MHRCYVVKDQPIRSLSMQRGHTTNVAMIAHYLTAVNDFSGCTSKKARTTYGLFGDSGSLLITDY